jgi:ribosome-binding protein aMBF1 (putative translation factor)
MEAIKELRKITREEPERASLLMAFLMIDGRVRLLPEKSRQEFLEQQKCLIEADNERDRAEILDTMLEILENKKPTYRRLAEKDLQSPGESLQKWMTYIGKRIKEERETAKLSQVELAEKSGLPQSHISRLENGQHSPTRLTLEKIAKALKIDVGKLDPSTE